MERKYTQKRALFILASIKIVNRTYALELCIMFVIFILLPEAYGKISQLVTVYSKKNRFRIIFCLIFFCDRVVLFYVYSLFTRIVILERHCLLDKCEWTKSFETNHTTEKHYSCLLCATFAQYAETMVSCKYADSSAPRNIFTKLFVINAKHYIESLHAPHKRCHFIIRLYSRDEIANKNKTTEP